MAKPSGKPGKKDGAQKGPTADRRDSDEILPVRQLSILIVDDDPVDRMTLLRALKGTKLDPKITETTDIASAIDLIRKNAFDVVLLDHILPDGKSIDLLRKLRDAGIRLPVIITTGYGDEMLVADLLKSGAADYLSKDRISADAVARAISHAIRIYKAEEEKFKKDTLLQAGAEAVILLNTQTERASVVSGALGILGKALGVDRLTAFEQASYATAKLPSISHRFEWSRDSEDFRFNDPGLQNVTYESLGLARWHATLSNGHSIGGTVRSLPPEEQPFFTGRGMISILAIPVLVDKRCWGFVLIEDRRVERTWTESEKSMLISVATAIGSTLMHRRADEALRQSEERFRTILEAQTDCICRFFPNGVVTFANEAYCRYVGRKREELIGRPFTPYLADEDRQKLLDQLSTLSPKRPIVISENRSVGPDGTVRCGQWTNQAIFNQQGQLVEIQAVGRDITDRKRIEQELGESKDYLNKIINTISDPIFVKDAQHRFVLVNDAECVLADSYREKMIGKTDYDFFPKEQVDVFWKYDELVLTTGQENMNEEDVTDAHGRVHTIVTKKARYTDPAGRHYIVGVIRDITERKKAEDELRLSEEQLRAQYKGFPLPTFTWTFMGDDFVLTDFNDAGMTLTDKTIQKYKGYKLAEFHKSRPDIIADIRRCADDKSTFCRETDLHFQTTGSVRRLNITYVFVPPNQVMVHTDDVTDRRRAEAALRESEAKYRTLAEASPDMIFMCAPNGDILYANTMGAKQWHLRPEEVAGKKQEELFPPEIAERHKASIRQVCETKRPFHSEVTEMLQQSKVWIESRLIPITNAAGEVTSVLGVSRNVTERRQMEDAVRESEANFRALAENALDGILICAGEDGHCVYANQSAITTSGYTAQELLALRAYDLVSPDQATLAMERYQKRSKGEAVLSRYESIMVKKNGEKVPVDISATRTVWRGQPAVLVLARDITIQKQLEMERSRLASSLLDIQEKERQEISAMLHDHLGQLLTLTRLELGSVSSFDANSKKSINNAIERIDEALGSIRRLAVSLRPPILDDLGIEVALETLTEEFADGSRIQTSFTHTGSKPALGNAEETCLYRVLQEALTNAAKHSGATRIDVQLRTSDDGVSLEINDNGKGFDKDAERNQTGIGFIGMRERLSRCGGSLEIVSETENGTTIRALIPKTGPEVPP